MDKAWFKDRKRELGLSDAAIGKAIGRDRSVANKILNGGVGFDAGHTAAFSDLFQVSEEEILRRFGVLVAPHHSARREPDLPPTRSVHANDETVEVAQIDLSFSMGPGTAIDDYVEETPVRFDLSYIRGFTRSEISRLRLARGVGDSMFPTLLPSDLLWLDTTQNRLNQADRIWACSILGAAAVKRLRRVGPGRIEVISDNPAVENAIYDEEDIIIHARVIRFTRDL